MMELGEIGVVFRWHPLAKQILDEYIIPKVSSRMSLFMHEMHEINEDWGAWEPAWNAF